MTIVRIIKDWNYPDIFRQTPAQNCKWNNILFTEENIESCDYAIILNKPLSDTIIKCEKENIWAIMQEPPNEISLYAHFGDKKYSKVFTTNERLMGKRYIHSQPALPWHVNRDYDYLSSCPIPEKARAISWITSNLSSFRGHKDRLKFLGSITEKLKFDLFGKGINFIPDKWDGLAPYKYSFAIENFSNSLYWSEKISDCFLTWTMPIYFGNKKLTSFFPEDSFIQIDISKPEEAIEIVKDKISSNTWDNNLEAINYARDLVLNKYQFFPMICSYIDTDEATISPRKNVKDTILIKAKITPPLSLELIIYKIKRFYSKIKQRLIKFIGKK
ncbi:MAG: hypothetical protein JEZ06_08740 [Anaerolineaceae bacterium]|nr:hypothetical protein [Anaerolineaceae bacterium]